MIDPGLHSKPANPTSPICRFRDRHHNRISVSSASAPSPCPKDTWRTTRSPQCVYGTRKVTSKAPNSGQQLHHQGHDADARTALPRWPSFASLPTFSAVPCHLFPAVHAPRSVSTVPSTFRPDHSARPCSSTFGLISRNRSMDPSHKVRRQRAITRERMSAPAVMNSAVWRRA